MYSSKGIDTVQQRKRRLEFIKKQIEQQSEWYSLKKFVAGISINLGIRPQVVKREFNLFVEWLGEKLEIRTNGSDLEFRYNNQPQPQ